MCIFKTPSSILHSYYFKLCLGLPPNTVATPYVSSYSLCYFMEKIERQKLKLYSLNFCLICI